MSNKTKNNTVISWSLAILSLGKESGFLPHHCSCSLCPGVLYSKAGRRSHTGLRHLLPREVGIQSSENQPVGQPKTTEPALIQAGAPGPGKTLKRNVVSLLWGEDFDSCEKLLEHCIPHNWLSQQSPCLKTHPEPFPTLFLWNFACLCLCLPSKEKKGGVIDRLEVKEWVLLFEN